MAWNPPISHAVGDILTASDWNLNTVDNPEYLLGDTVWTNATTQNSWVGGSVAPGYIREGNTVVLRGNVQGGTIGNAAFTLPTGYRPSSLLAMACAVDLQTGYCQVTTAGLVIPVVPAGGTQWAFDGMSFSIL